MTDSILLNQEALKLFRNGIKDSNYFNIEIKGLLLKDEQTNNKWRIKYLTAELRKNDKNLLERIMEDDFQGERFSFLHRIYDISMLDNFLSNSVEKRELNFDEINCYFTHLSSPEKQSVFYHFSPEGSYGIESAYHSLTITGITKDMENDVILEMIQTNKGKVSPPQILTNFFGFNFGPESFNFGFDDFIIFLAPL